MSLYPDILDVAIIGGGAAGFFSGIQLLEQDSALSVTIFEASSKPLNKVRISGGGRCNLTHAEFDIEKLIESYPRGGKFLYSLFSRFAPSDTMDWFEARGVPLKIEDDGRVFPQSDDSASVVHCLRDRFYRLKGRLETQTKIVDVQHDGDIFTIATKKRTVLARRVILATGGTPWGWTVLKGLGEQPIEAKPSLFSFNICSQVIDGLAGVSWNQPLLRLVVGDQVFEEKGPVLITDWGLSGPAVIRLSAWAAVALRESGYQARLELPWWSEEMVSKWQSEYCESRKKLVNENPSALPNRLWVRLMTYFGWQEYYWRDLQAADWEKLIEQADSFFFKVSGRTTYKYEFVTAGGMRLSQLNPKSCEVKSIPGLYIVGELLNIDGITGGFNFQNAWSSGFVAACSILGSVDH